MNDAAHLLDPDGHSPYAGRRDYLSKKARKMIDYMNPRKWRCTKCGKICEFASEDWRWNGQAWEHSHGWPIGHVPAERIKDEDTTFPHPVCGPERPGV